MKKYIFPAFKAQFNDPIVTPQIDTARANINNKTLSMIMHISTQDGTGKLFAVDFEDMPLIGTSWDDLPEPKSGILSQMIGEKLKEFEVIDNNLQKISTTK